MMTEKRFALEYDGNCYKCIVDCNNGTLYTDRKQIVELLNELHEENKKLKQVNEMLQMDFTMTERNLIEENDQLKKELDQFYLLIGRGDWSGLVDLIKGDVE